MNSSKHTPMDQRSLDQPLVDNQPLMDHQLTDQTSFMTDDISAKRVGGTSGIQIYENPLLDKNSPKNSDSKVPLKRSQNDDPLLEKRNRNCNLKVGRW